MSDAPLGIDASLPPAVFASPVALNAPPLLNRRAVAAVVAGNMLEFYDFIGFSFFAVYIGRAFFPEAGEFGSLLASLATYGVGFFTRPLGGVLISAFADRTGRKPAMILTAVLITVGTLGLALTPTYADIGLAAPVILVACRLLQGFALGGDVGPSTALLLEGAPADARGLYASWQIASQGLAVVAAGVTGALVSLWLSPQDLAAWGWRIPFLLSLLLIPIVVYIRHQLPETVENSARQKSGAQLVGLVFTKYQRYLVLGFLMIIGGTVSTQVGLYMTTYAIQTLKLPAMLAQSGTVLGGVTTFAFALLAGAMSDRYGRKALILWPRVLLVLLIIPMFWWLGSSPGPATLLAVTALVTALTAASGGASLAAIPELMPIALRSTGTAIIYTAGTTLFGGTTQFVITWLLHVTGNPLSLAYYVVVTGVVSVVATLLLPETRDVDIRQAGCVPLCRCAN